MAKKNIKQEKINKVLFVLVGVLVLYSGALTYLLYKASSPSTVDESLGRMIWNNTLKIDNLERCVEWQDKSFNSSDTDTCAKPEAFINNKDLDY